ncbi:hypothetical protein BV329_05573 [Pseudomonas syringae pv. actinidiae]|nr:hypothetical protein BV329_05573 [Pseudomonas syringae pv. actinidiae]
MNININISDPIYWINKPTRPITPFIHTNNTTINKPRHSHPPVSRSRNYRIPQ